MKRRVPNIDKIRRLIGWKPQRSMNRILNDVVAYEQSIASLRTEAIAIPM